MLSDENSGLIAKAWFRSRKNLPSPNCPKIVARGASSRKPEDSRSD